MIQQTLSYLDPIIEEKSLLKHPFYVKWTRGELTLDDLRIYAKEYYHLARRVPEVVEAIAKHVPAENTAMMEQIEKNRTEEMEHVELWERFAKALGISKEELLAYEPSDLVQTAVNELVKLAEMSYEDGVVAMYAFECELPKIAQTKKEGLEEFYGLVSEDAHIYFDEHLGEEEHLKVWRNIPVEEAQGLKSAHASLDAQNKVLDAVCVAGGIDCHC